ncbi:hypothetical protein [Fusobacterium sp. IOR10]|uniref:hypothetical protein n=1 Tax=Fusobacterium sp. IOR10 TaxID=2665157 RepID=UPI0013D3F488|nr:hypothetical protein [Fusobacterium sp. IOR10]
MKIKIVKYIEKFMCKYLGTEVLEGIVLTLLKDLVKRTGSKIDDKIYKVIFESISKEEDSKC